MKRQDEPRPIVLLVEDDADALTMYRYGLGAEGFQVEAAASAEDARRALTRAVPDAVVTDMSMAGASGLAVIEAVRERQGARHVPIVALTGVSRDSEIWRSRPDWGWDRYVVKPVTADELAQILRELIAAEAAGRSTPPE